MSAAQNGPHPPKPTACPWPEFEGQKSGAAILMTILAVFLGVCLIGGGGIVAAYMVMDEGEDESTVAANTTGPSANSRPGNPNTGPRRPVTGTRKIESIDDAVKWLADNSSSKQRDAVRWLSSRPVDRGRQKEIARALSRRLLTGSSFYANDIIDALEVWGSTPYQSGP